MKKLLSFFLSIALLSTLSFTAYATEVAPSVPQEHAIPSIPEEISFSHNRIIKGVADCRRPIRYERILWL